MMLVPRNYIIIIKLLELILNKSFVNLGIILVSCVFSIEKFVFIGVIFVELTGSEMMQPSGGLHEMAVVIEEFKLVKIY